MIYAKTNADDRLHLYSENGTRFEIGPGELNGVINIQAFLDQNRGIDRDKAYVRISYGFACSEGTGYVYVNILRPWAFWPVPPIVVRPAEGAFKKHVTLKCLLDTRDCEPIRFADGRELVNRHKYNDVTIQLREEEWHVAVRLTVYIGDLTNGSENSFLSMDYDIPWGQLLWRRAPKYFEDDVVPEACDYFPIKPTGVPPVKGVTPSPIRVLPAE